MGMMLLIHIAAGGVGIVSGYAALLAAKGSPLHRRAGVVFVGSMMTMGLFAAWLAAAKGELGNVIAGVLTTYLVVTALTTVRPPTVASRRVDVAAMGVALATGVAGVALTLQSYLQGDGTRDGVPARIYLVFATVALLSGLSDLRIMRAGGVRGVPRLRRHLWRMCVALFIAAGSFFLGQADEIPERLRVFPVLALLSFTPLLAMAFWLWRVRIRKTPRGPARTAFPERVVPARVRELPV
jgi:ABC-type uncharacterized transport system permease subunit